MARTTKRARKEPVEKSARSRKRGAASVEAPVQDEEPETVEMEEAAPEATAAAPRTDRRAQMAEIAQRRAAHFATFRTEDDEETGAANVHVGGDEACGLGPWSSARQLVAQRAAAQEARQERLLAGETEDQEEDTLDWKPSRPNWENTADMPRERSIKPLAELCVNKIADFVDCVESLVGLPQNHINAIARCAATQRKINEDVWQLFTDGSPSEVVIPNCTDVNEAAMLKGLKDACTYRLEVLDLGFCGRGFGDPAAAALAAAGPMPALRRLRLAGAYRLSPAALVKALAATPNLTELALPHCMRLDGSEVLQIAEALPNLKKVDFSGCRGMGSAALAEGLKAMQNLESVYLDEVEGVTDAVLSALATPRLQVLHASRCRNITDEGVAAIATVATDALTDINLAETTITSAALDMLACHCSCIHTLCVRQCKKIKSESALIAIAQNGQLRKLDVGFLDVATSALFLELASSCSDSLISLSLNFCRNVPPLAVGAAVDACKELEYLNVFGCSQLTKAALRGHRNDRVVVHGEPSFEGGSEGRLIEPIAVLPVEAVEAAA